MESLPRVGWSRDQIDRQLSAFYDSDPPRRKSAMSVSAHYVSDEIQSVIERAHNQFSHHHDAVLLSQAGSREMEHELLSIAGELLSGGTTGTVTTMSLSGTEAAFNALFAARTRARLERPHIRRPEVVAPYSAHAAYTKIAAYLDLTLRRAPHGDDLRCDAAAIEDLIGPNTIAIVASAPDWPYGYFDDIPALGRLASTHGLWLHVDATLGGFIAPFAAAIGETITPWDFSVDGVSTIAAGLGTWAYAMKPTTVLAWRESALLQHSIVPVEDWPVRGYLTTGFSGTRPTGPVAAAWAVMHHLGHDGYRLLARHLIDGKRVYAKRLAAIPGVRIREPGLVNLNFDHVSTPADVIVDRMAQRGWAHYSCDEPPLVALYLDAASFDVIDEYISDLSAVLQSDAAPGGVNRSLIT